MATLNQAYLEWEQRTRSEGEQQGIALGEQRGMVLGAQREAIALILGQLTHKFGPLPVALTTQIEQLPLDQLKILSVAWLDFQGLAELESWLQHR